MTDVMGNESSSNGFTTAVKSEESSDSFIILTGDGWWVASARGEMKGRTPLRLGATLRT